MQVGCVNMDVVLKNLGMVCALGANCDEIARRCACGDVSGMFGGDVVVGGVRVPFGGAPVKSEHAVRCHDLIVAALGQIRADIENLKQVYDCSRLGIVCGASNTAIHEAQQQMNEFMDNGIVPDAFAFDEIELGMPAEFIRQYTGFRGPCYTVSTACSSAIKVFRSARDLLVNDVCDAVLVGGVDARCDFALNGFNALGALSMRHTNPMSVNRDGINLGEGAAFMIMVRGADGIRLMGVGESSDAYHLTSPDPTGNGAMAAMQGALDDAKIKPCDIDIIQMHGTGTRANDAMESRAIFNLFGNQVLCASTKPMTGHVLGAAGAISAGLAWLMIKNQFVAPHIWDEKSDAECAQIRLANVGDKCNVRRVMCNAFAFGGSNASMILGVQND